MTELTVSILRYALLGLLWFFVLSVVLVLRTDLFGPKITQRRTPKAKTPRAPKQARQPAQPKAPPAPPGMPRRLLVTAGPLAGTAIPLLNTPVLIGRSPECTLVLSDDYSSGRHLRLYPDGPRWIAEDLGSTNGTYLGRTRLTTPTEVRVGQELRIGTTILALKG